MSTPPAPPELRPLPRRRVTATGPLPEMPASVVAERPSGPAVVEDLPPIERVPRDGRLPATFYQQWAWETLNGEPSANLNLPFVVRFNLPVSLPVLFASLRELERRQEGLRSRLVRAAEEPWALCQVVEPPGRLAVPLIDLTRLGPAAREAERGRLATEDAARPLHLTAMTMFRAQLVRLGETDHTLLLNLCHLFGDGWSIELLRAELAALYTAFAAGHPSPLPELPIQFADFAVWQRRIAAGAVVLRQLEYWRERLAAVPIPLVLQGDWPDLPRQGKGTVQSGCGFSAPVTARIRDLARAQGATTAILLLAAFGLLLSAYTGETDVVIESMVLGRLHPELAAVVGLFINSLPHRTDLSGHPSFAEALRRTRDGVVEDYCNQDVSFPKLMLELYPGRRYLSRVAFNMLSFPTETSLETWDREQAIFSYEGRRPDLEAPKYDLLVMGHEDREQLRLVLVGTAARFNEQTMADVAADLEKLITRALVEPGAPVAHLLPQPRYRYARPTD
ncbi:MAG TPA: condensation domain-containing protein [Thermoanaerobaculia bacterium]|nr:condensation domain-containing protein [Thermoanaerobaculia bacterium]